MDVTLAATCATALLVGCLLLFGRTLVRGPRDIVLVFLLVVGQFYVLRPVLLVLGLDGPSPDEQFTLAESSAVLTRTVLGVVIWVTVVLAGVAVVRRSGVQGWGPFVRGHVDLRRAALVSLALTAVGTAISLFLLWRFGGINGVVTAAKVDKALAGLFVLRAVPALGAIVAVGTYLEARGQRATRVLTTVALVCAFLNAASVFLWGSRSLLVVVAATMVLGLGRRGFRGTGWRAGSAGRWQIVLRLTTAALLVITIAGGLRMTRDTLINGEVQDVYAQAGPARQVSLALNATYFDAAMLAGRDWPAEHEYRYGEDFVVGLLGLVPRFLWEGKPAAIAPGVWFRQAYEPEKVNGWPMGAAGLWYLNFGILGLVLGGMLSGALVGWLSAAQLRRPDNGFNTAVAVAVGIYVVGLGVDSDLLVRCVLWLVPLWAIGRFVSPRSRASEPFAPEPLARTRAQAHTQVFSPS